MVNVAAQRKHRLLPDGSVRPALERRQSKAASERTGACSAPIASRNSRSPARVIEDPTWPWKAGRRLRCSRCCRCSGSRAISSAFSWRGLLFFCALIQMSASLLVWSATLPFDFYLDPFDWTMLVLLFPAQLAIILILLINGFEFTEVLWRTRWLRDFGLLPPEPGEQQPFVSIHLACCNEPPEMVILTLDSLAALDYENFEVLVIDNNTKNEEVWKPVEEHCAKLGARFRFFHLNPWPGFKAGALNFGLEGNRRARRGDRGGRCRLRSARGLAARAHRLFPRSESRRRAVPAGAPRLRAQRVPPHDQLGIRRLLPHRHAPSQRAQRDHPARHHDHGPAQRARRAPARGRNGRSARTPNSACA